MVVSAINCRVLSQVRCLAQLGQLTQLRDMAACSRVGAPSEPSKCCIFVGADIDEVFVAGTSQGWLFGLPVLALNLPGFHVTRPDVASSSQGALPCCVLTPVPLRRDAVCGSNNWQLFQAFGIVFEDSRSLRHGVQSATFLRSVVCRGAAVAPAC
jgi:hypothetical protein